MVVYSHDVMSRIGLRWRYYSHNGAHFMITPHARRDTAIFTALCALVESALPGAKMSSRPAKNQAERYFVEAVNAATRFVRETPAMLDYMDPLAGLGLTGVQERGTFNPDTDEVSFLDRARESHCARQTSSLNIYRVDKIGMKTDTRLYELTKSVSKLDNAYFWGERRGG